MSVNDKISSEIGKEMLKQDDRDANMVKHQNGKEIYMATPDDINAVLTYVVIQAQTPLVSDLEQILSICGLTSKGRFTVYNYQNTFLQIPRNKENANGIKQCRKDYKDKDELLVDS